MTAEVPPLSTMPAEVQTSAATKQKSIPKTALQIAERRGMYIIGFAGIVALSIMYMVFTLDYIETSIRDAVFAGLVVMMCAIIAMFAIMYRNVERQKFECAIGTNNIQQAHLANIQQLQHHLEEKDMESRLASQKAATITNAVLSRPYQVSSSP